MKSYRINCVDELGKLVATHEMMFRDDLAALNKANELCVDNSIEVWDGVRRVLWMKKGGEPRYEAVLNAIAPPNSRSAQDEIDRLEALSA